jgi:hypothetical protein
MGGFRGSWHVLQPYSEGSAVYVKIDAQGIASGNPLSRWHEMRRRPCRSSTRWRLSSSLFFAMRQSPRIHGHSRGALEGEQVRRMSWFDFGLTYKVLDSRHKIDLVERPWHMIQA